MITFTQFLAEARMAPLYHGTRINFVHQMIKDGGIAAKTQHHASTVGYAPHKLDTEGRLTPVSSANKRFFYGISTTRKFKFAQRWGGYNDSRRVVLELNQQKISLRYKIRPVNYWGWGEKQARFEGDDHENNEFEEFIILDKGKKLPLNTITKIYVCGKPDTIIREWANSHNVEIHNLE